MKYIMKLGFGFIMFSLFLWISFAQSRPSVKIAKLALPTNVRLEAGENAIIVMWDASPDEADYNHAGYNVYFDTRPLDLLSLDRFSYELQVRRSIHECVVRGLKNGQQYFFHVRSRKGDGSTSEASLPEKQTMPQFEGKNYGVYIYDEEVSAPVSNGGYSWSRKNGQGNPIYNYAKQDGKYVDILMMESPASKIKSVFISPSKADFTKDWSFRNETLIADIGTNWVMAEPPSDTAFTTTTDIKKGHVYILRTHDNYYIKLRIDSIEEVNLLLPFGGKRRDTHINKVSFTYISQLGQSY